MVHVTFLMEKQGSQQFTDCPVRIKIPLRPLRVKERTRLSNRPSRMRRFLYVKEPLREYCCGEWVSG